MKKIIIAIILFLIFVVLALFLTFSFLNKEANVKNNYEDLQQKIINNSKWLALSQDDINGYIGNTYTDTMKKVVNSLEEAIPVIFQISGSKFSNSTDGSFIIVSAFTPSNNVYIYYYDFSRKKYVKETTTLSSVLENATNVFICTNPEVLK